MSISLLERRHPHADSTSTLRHAINDEQRDALRVLERFGWTLKFVRRDAARGPVAWVYDPDQKRMAMIEPDGTLVEDAALACRA